MTQLPTACVIGAGSSGIAAAKALHERGVDVRLLREVRPRRRQLGVRQQQRHVVRLPLAAHQHLARADGVLGLPDAEVAIPTSRTTPTSRVLRRLRRPLRLPRQDPVRDRRRARRAAATTASGRSRSRTARRGATTPCSSPTATTGTRAGPSRRSPGDVRRPRDALAPLHRHPTSSAASASSCSAWATARWTSPSRPAYVADARLPRRAPRRARHPQVPLRQAARPALAAGQARRRLADPRIPYAVRRRLLEKAVEKQVGNMERYGLPEARPPPRRGPPDGLRTTSSIASPTATITPKPNIAGSQGDRVQFADGTRRSRPTSSSTAPATRSRSRSSTRTSSRRPTTTCRSSAASSTPTSPSVFFLGAAAAARRDHAARRGAGRTGSRDHLKGEYALPTRGRDARATSRRERRRMFKRYVASKRHTMQVDFDDYLLELRQRAPARRASARAPGRLRAAGRAPGAARGDGRRSPRERRAAAARRAGASAPRPPTARRSSTRRARSSPSSATAPRPCATSSAAPTSPAARSTTTSPTRRRCSARWSTRAGASARPRGARRAPAATTSRSSSATPTARTSPSSSRIRRPFELARRNAGTIRALFDEPVLGAARDELHDDLRAAIERGEMPPLDADYMAARDGRGRARGRRSA